MTRNSVLKTFLWYPKDLHKVLEFYKSTFPGFELQSETNLADGQTFIAEFSIYGHKLVAMCTPHGEKFNTSISLSLLVDGQAEVDRIWEAITEKGEPGRCGWCTDEFGVSWQIVPMQMHEHLASADPAKALYANQALMKMSKIVIEDLYE